MATTGTQYTSTEFRILLETESGLQYAWGNQTLITINAQGAPGIDANIVTGAINNMNQIVFLEDVNDPNYTSTTSPTNVGTFTNNQWLECGYTDGDGSGTGASDGHIFFKHKDDQDISDPLLRFKFYGTKACDIFGLPYNQWIYPAGFNLSTVDEVPSFFQGVGVLTSATFLQDFNILSTARSRGVFTFDASGSEQNNAGMMFTTGSDVIGFCGFNAFESASLCQFDIISGSVIRSAGDVIALYTSDERLKDNVEYILDPISKVKQLNGVEFEWNESQSLYPVGTKDVGIIAQDLQKVYPELVSESATGYLGVKHDRLVGLLIEAIKEQSNQIESLTERIKKLENK